MTAARSYDRAALTQTQRFAVAGVMATRPSDPPTPVRPGAAMIVVDIQDVGRRVYTFIYIVANCMRAAARAIAQGRGQ